MPALRASTHYRILLSLAALAVCASAADMVGTAGVYSDWFDGKTMANGDPVDQNELTAAAGSFPLGSSVRVTNLETSDSAIVRVTDRLGPEPDAMIILTRAAAQRLGLSDVSQQEVRLELVGTPIEAGERRAGRRDAGKGRKARGGLGPPGSKPSPFASSRTILAKR